MMNYTPTTGISVAYVAENSPPIVDIVFVHGLHGHPFKTWTYNPKNPDTLESSTLTGKKEEKRSGIRRMLWRPSKAATLPEGNGTQLRPVFWPADLLPKECPNSRILMFGYDSKVTKYTAGAVSRNSILSHSKDLLFALCRTRELNRRLVFVAHSLGGIVVKEMLARSSSSLETELKNIVESTAKVIFLGTPHRGSQDVAALGEVVRSIVSSFGMETNPVILDALGLKTTDLQRAQEDFSKLWQEYDFKVKTFQEGLSLTKLGKKVVPDYSSLIGDYREYAETLQANHIEMCRYSGTEDPNYRKVAGELHSIYHSIVKLTGLETSPSDRPIRLPRPVSSAASSSETIRIVDIKKTNEDCLRSLWFGAINTRLQSLERPADQTCSWLFKHDFYQDWFNSRSRQESYGLLWLKGKPGSGKSTLMKEAFRRAALSQVKPDYCTAAFFFSAKGDKLEHSYLGHLRSLLCQILPEDKRHLQRLREMWRDKRKFPRGDGETTKVIWTESELSSLLEAMLVHQARKRTIIFIDALDECEESKIRAVAYFWRRITKSAYDQGVDLNVCLSSRHFPTITLTDCPEIIVEQHNTRDIATYLNHKFQLSIATQGPQWKSLRQKILRKADGVFLWVVLVVEDVLKSWDEGNGMSYLTKRVMDVPEELETLFSNMFSNLDPKAKELTVRFFQWATLATKPLRLYEWNHIMAFIRQPAFGSLSEWRKSDYVTESSEQLEKRIRSISRGLVEVKRVRPGDSKDRGLEFISVDGGAGSLNLEYGDTRIVHVIHESVRDFFLKGKGFSMLDPNLECDPIGNGHLSIMATCLDYLNITELDSLVEARRLVPVTKALRIAPDGLSTNLIPPTFERPQSMQTSQPSTEIEEGISVFEMLKLLDYAPGVDVVEWMAEGDAISDGQTHMDGSICESATNSIDGGRPRVLEDDPALLSYATFKLFTHAQLAKQNGVDVQPFVERLIDGGAWNRWLALREDIPNRTSMRSYLVRMDLWPRDIPLPCGEENGARSYQSSISFSDVSPSVVSFSSAASHVY